MNTNNAIGQKPASRKLATGLGLLTSLALVFSASFIATDLVSRLGAEPPATLFVPAGDNTVANTEMLWMPFLEKAVLMSVSIVTLAILSPLFGAFCLIGLVRRYGKHLGLFIHVEYTRQHPVVVGPNAIGVARAATCTAQPLNLGPSFEEERLHEAKQTSNMASGMLGQLFEDNVKLQRMIELAREKEKAETVEGSSQPVLSSIAS